MNESANQPLNQKINPKLKTLIEMVQKINEELANKNKKLTEDKEKIEKEKEKLAEDNKELINRIFKIQDEKDQINKENKEISKEYSQIKDENKEISKEYYKLKYDNAKLMNEKKKCKNFAKRKEKKLEEVMNDLNNLTTSIKEFVDIKEINEEIKSKATQLIKNLSSAKSKTEEQKKSQNNESESIEKLSSNSSDNNSNHIEDIPPNSPEKDKSKNSDSLDLNIQNEKEQKNLEYIVEKSAYTMPIKEDQIKLTDKSSPSMNKDERIKATKPLTAFEDYHQSQTEVPPHPQTIQAENFTSQYFTDDDLVEGNKSSQNIDAKDPSKKFSTMPKTSAGLPKGATQKIDIDQVNKEIEQSEKEDKNEEKPKDSKEESKEENKKQN